MHIRVCSSLYMYVSRNFGDVLSHTLKPPCTGHGECLAQTSCILWESSMLNTWWIMPPVIYIRHVCKKILPARASLHSQMERTNISFGWRQDDWHCNWYIIRLIGVLLVQRWMLETSPIQGSLPSCPATFTPYPFPASASCSWQGQLASIGGGLRGWWNVTWKTSLLGAWVRGLT